ncbi:hypothetical protein QZH41_000242 [Actinostola sp. cb2023]|nr:hypothetical protein QZH41_000242 [Actinostola sp. cb2023]
MPFGVTNGPGTFQRLMNLVLKGLTWKECLVYLDDIVVWSKDYEEHLAKAKFEWGPDQESVFSKPKQRLVEPPVLAYPNFDPGGSQFILDTDASTEHGIGAVLSQVQADGSERVVAYGSRSLQPAEKNYCVTRLEMLALVDFIDHFRLHDGWNGCKSTILKSVTDRVETMATLMHYQGDRDANMVTARRVTEKY